MLAMATFNTCGQSGYSNNASAKVPERETDRERKQTEVEFFSERARTAILMNDDVHCAYKSTIASRILHTAFTLISKFISSAPSGIEYFQTSRPIDWKCAVKTIQWELR